MKSKDYDDDLLVELIARGEMPLAEIAQRLGLGISTVRRISTGQSRPELQEKLIARMRTCLGERRRGRRQSGGNGAAAVRPGGRRKDYDDDLLVELIARGEMSYAEIAERIGVQRSMVGMIARGEKRPDLQERINRRMRGQLADKRRRPSQTAGETGGGPPVVPGGRRKEYDDDLLVELIARGEMSYARIGKRVGLSATTVAKIAGGESRVDLQPRIAAISRGIQEEACRLGARWLRGLLTRHIRDGMEGTGEYARRCRMDLIDKLFDPEILKRITEPPPEPEPPGADFDDLSLELRRKIMQEIGGPCDDAGFAPFDADGEGESA